MKKLLLFPLFLFLASTAFAEISVSGSASAGTTLIKGSNIRGGNLEAGNSLSGSLGVSASNDDETFGGGVRVKGDTETDGGAGLSASAWWKPIEQLKLQLGGIDDFALTEIVGWGYHANDAEDYVVAAPYSYAGSIFTTDTGFYNGTGSKWTGATLTFTPFYGLDVNIGFPFIRGNAYIIEIESSNHTELKTIKTKAQDVYLFGSAQASYTLWGIGRFAVSFMGGGDGTIRPYAEEKPSADYTVEFLEDNYLNVYSSTVYASFLWDTFDIFNVNVGVRYVFPAKSGDLNLRYNPPIAAGLGISFGYDNIGIKTRFAATFLGSASKEGGMTLKEPVKLGFGILPYYRLEPYTTFYLNLSVSYRGNEQVMAENGTVSTVLNSAAIGWYVNPYLTVQIGYGTFFAGFRLESDGIRKVWDSDGDLVPNYTVGVPVIEWSVPIGIQFTF